MNTRPPPPPPGHGRTLRTKLPPFAHHSLAFSPFFEERIAVASGTNFGLVGNGRVHILSLTPGGLNVMKWFDTQDSVYDVAWNESHENQVIAACGNGSLRLFDLSLEGLPTQVWHEHSAEVSSVDWNNIQKDQFVSASWDQSVKIWSLHRQTSLQTIPAHTSQIYSAQFSPHNPSLISTCAADGLLKVFDTRHPNKPVPVQAWQASSEEVLSCDWNKYDTGLIATGGKDRVVKLWDIRTGGCVEELKGHGLAVKRVQWSPHHRNIIASTSYDMTCRSWNTQLASPRTIHSDHTEFCMGVAWALFDPGLLASCAWDQEVHLFRA